MGTVISKGVNGFGAVLGNAFIAPFRAIFGDSCEFVRSFVSSSILQVLPFTEFWIFHREVCQGTWDIICFLEHLCVSNIIRLLMVLGLTYISKFLNWISFLEFFGNLLLGIIISSFSSMISSVVLLSNIQNGHNPMLSKRILQDGLGSMSSVLVYIGVHHLLPLL